MASNSWRADIRLLLNILCAPKLRMQFAQAITDAVVTGPISRLSFIGEEGVIETAALSLRNRFNASTGPLGILQFSTIDLPTNSCKRVPLSQEACKVAFERAGWSTCTEAELNAALAQLVDDVALARRDCVDSGFLIRDLAGVRYHLA